MPRGYRCIVFAAVGWLALCASKAPDEGAQPEQTNTSQSIEKALKPAALAAKAVKSVNASKYQRPCPNPQNTDDDDLCAQWQAANGASDAAFWAKWQFWSSIGGIAGLFAVFITLRQSQKEHLAVHGPKLVVGDVHAWNNGKGGLQDRLTEPLNLVPGSKITIAILASNVGSADAIIWGSDCQVYWGGDKLPMIKPHWGGLNHVRAGKMDGGPPARIDVMEYPMTIEPIRAAGWILETEVGAISQTLYLLGIIFYRDRLHNHRVYAFARKYDRKVRRFVIVDDPDYERPM